MAQRNIRATKDYRLFERHSSENRTLDAGKHKRLLDSMKLYGFLPCFPVVVNRGPNGRLIVKDGQHRLLLAETLGLPVYFVEDESDFDIAVVNSAAKPWTTRDYAQKHAANGLRDYQELLEFSEKFGLPVSTSACLLGGTSCFHNIQSAYQSGSWKVKDRPWANAVAAVYVPMVKLAKVMKNARFVEACMAVCRVDGFDPARLVANSQRCPDRLLSYSTRDAYLDMMEEVYNFGRKQLMGLKSAAVMAMRERNPKHNPAVGRKHLAKASAAARQCAA